MLIDLGPILAERILKDDNYIQRIQSMVWGRDFIWTPMSNFFIAPKEVIVVERFTPYIWVSFDWEIRHDHFNVVKTSGKGKRSTSHFRELISKN